MSFHLADKIDKLVKIAVNAAYKDKKGSNKVVLAAKMPNKVQRTAYAECGPKCKSDKTFHKRMASYHDRMKKHHLSESNSKDHTNPENLWHRERAHCHGALCSAHQKMVDSYGK